MRALPILLVALAACPAEAPPADDGPPADVVEVPAEPEVPVKTVKEHMGEHYVQGLAARDAAIAGDLVAVAAASGWLAQHEAHDAPESWAPHLQEMRTAAGRAASATEMATAAEAVAVLGTACGACHSGHESALPVIVPEPPAAAEGMEAHMVRHQWAIERMWMGLVGPSDEAWAKGASMLVDEPMGADAHPEGKEEVAKAFHALAPQATEATDGASRAVVYGKLIATCAECHPSPTAPAEPAPEEPTPAE